MSVNLEYRLLSIYHLLSNRLRKMTASAFMVIKNASNTIMAAEVFSTNARSGLSAHK